jgi:hypothetical protein
VQRIVVAVSSVGRRPTLALSGAGSQLEVVSLEPQGLLSLGTLTGLGPHVAVGDLDGDGRPELIAGGPEGLYRFWPQDGGLVAPQARLVGGPTIKPELGDLDGDGQPEIVTASPQGVVVLHVGAEGRLDELTAAPLLGAAAAIKLVDIDGDAQLDVLVAYQGAAATDTLRNSGAGRFEQRRQAIDRRALVAADFNGDGDLDLLAAEPPGGYCLRAGAGQSLVRAADFPEMGPLQAVGLADFRGIGRPDIYLVSAVGVFVLRNESPLVGDANGDRRVDLADFAALKQGFGRSGQQSNGDFNGDGQVDLADVPLLKRHFGRRTSPLVGQ